MSCFSEIIESRRLSETQPSVSRSIDFAAHRTVAIVWQRFGPYHLARLNGAADALRRNGWQVVGIEVASTDQYEWCAAGGTVASHITVFPNHSYGVLAAHDIRREVGRALGRINPSAVCVNGWAAPEAVAALGWARKVGARTVLMSETFESRFNPLKRTVRRWRVRTCHAAIVGGGIHARYLRELGFSSGPVELGYDVVDNSHFATNVSTPPAWFVPLRHYFFANTRFLERKGIDALLRAYAQYQRMTTSESNTRWNLVISGSGRMERAWKELSTALRIAEDVHWPGFMQYEELPAAYQFAGAFIHPARQEPWGLVVNEAAAAGLPLLIGRKVGAAFELVRDGENGFLLDPDNVEDFARLLLRVSRLPEETRREMGLRSQQIVAAFGPERFGQALGRCLQLQS